MEESYEQNSDNQIAFDTTGYKKVGDLVCMVPAGYDEKLLVSQL